MAAGPFLLLPLLLLPGSAARPAAPRAPRHSDGTFTSELSRLRERAQLQRLLQGLVGKRRANSDLGFGGSDQDTENSTAWTKAAQGRSCLLWSEVPAPQAWIPLRDHLQQAWSPPLPPRLSSGAMVSEPASPAAGTQMRP